MTGISVSVMNMDDLDGVMGVETESFSIPWSRWSFERELLDNRFAHYIVAREDDRVVGYAGMWIILDEGHITNIAVHPLYRRRGIGRVILKELIRYGALKGVERFTLEVRASNRKAIDLYTKEGFTVSGIRKGYYSDTNEDALIMWMET